MSKKAKYTIQDWNRIKPSTNVVFNIIFALLAAICIIPVIFIFMISISSEASIQEFGYKFFPSAYSLESYRFLFKELGTILHALLISVLVSVIGTVIGLFLTTTLAYSLSEEESAAFLAQQVAAHQCGTQSQIEDAGTDDGHNGVDQSGNGAHLGPGVGNLLGNTHDIGLVEVAHQRIGNHIEGHAGGAGGDGGTGDIGLGVLLGDLEDLVGEQTDDQTDAELEQEGLGSGGHIGAGQIGDGHADGTGHTAPEAAQKQGCQHAEYIAQMEGGLLGAHGDVDLEDHKADVAQGCEQSSQSQGAGVGLSGLGMGHDAHDEHDKAHERQDQAQSKDHLVPGGGFLDDGGGAGHGNQHAADGHGNQAEDGCESFGVHEEFLLLVCFLVGADYNMNW